MHRMVMVSDGWSRRELLFLCFFCARRWRARTRHMHSQQRGRAAANVPADLHSPIGHAHLIDRGPALGWRNFQQQQQQVGSALFVCCCSYATFICPRQLRESALLSGWRSEKLSIISASLARSPARASWLVDSPAGWLASSANFSTSLQVASRQSAQSRFLSASLHPPLINLRRLLMKASTGPFDAPSPNLSAFSTDAIAANQCRHLAATLCHLPAASDRPLGWPVLLTGRPVTRIALPLLDS